MELRARKAWPIARLRLEAEKPEEGVVGIGEAAVGRAPEDRIALRVDETFVTGFALIELRVHRGCACERLLQTGACVFQLPRLKRHQLHSPARDRELMQQE